VAKVDVCSTRWEASRVDTQNPSMPVAHVCGLKMGHPSVCRCACGAWRRGSADRPDRQYVGTVEAARYLGVSETVLRQLANEGAGPRVRMIGQRRHYKLAWLDEWMERDA
jgi:excisionase family DNA binding protein